MDPQSLINIAGKKLAVGLTWVALPGIASQAREIAQIATETGCRYGVVLSTDDSVVVGLSAKPLKAPSGAAWVAAGSKGEDIVLLEPVGDDHVWVCAVRNSAPQPEFDVVVHVSEVAATLERLEAICKFKIVSKHFEGADDERDFLEVIDGKRPNAVRQITGINGSVKLAAAGLVGVVVLGLVWSEYSKRREQEAAQERLAVLNASQAEAQKREADLRRQQERIAAEAAVKARVTSAPSPADFVATSLSAIEDLPRVAAQWRLSSVTCDTSACKISWSRTKSGTTEGFLAAAEKAGWQVQSHDFNTAQTTIAISVPGRNGSLNDVPIEEAANISLRSALQQLALAGVSSTISPAISPAAAPPKAPGAPASSPAAVSVPWKVGTLQLTGKRFFEIRGIPDYLQRNYVALSSLTYKAEASTWTMEGSYAVK